MKNLLLRARVVVRTSKSSFTQGDFVARQVALNFEHVRIAAISRATNPVKSAAVHTRDLLSPQNRLSIAALIARQNRSV